jgi:type I restriction-modification system DNA methylase subunit
MRKLEKALAKEKATGDPVAEAFGETASGVLKAAQYLRRRDFHIVVTNPPFFGRANDEENLKKFFISSYQDFQYDLATCFIKRCQLFSYKGGRYALVLPQNWLFLTTYINMRCSIINNQQIEILTRLGPHAFETISGEVMFK